MTFNEAVAIADGILALVAVIVCLRAAKRHPVKRYLWLMTALIMAYFTALAYQVVVGPGSAFALGQLLRPTLGLFFTLIIAHALVDSRER